MHLIRKRGERNRVGKLISLEVKRKENYPYNNIYAEREREKEVVCIHLERPVGGGSRYTVSTEENQRVEPVQFLARVSYGMSVSQSYANAIAKSEVRAKVNALVSKIDLAFYAQIVSFLVYLYKDTRLDNYITYRH